MHSIGEASAGGDGARRAVGVGTTLLLHATLGWAAWTGLDTATPTVPVPLEVRFIEAAQAVAPAPPQPVAEPAVQPVAEPPQPVAEPPPQPIAEPLPPSVEPPPQPVAEPRVQPVVRQPHPKPKPIRKAQERRPIPDVPRIVQPPPAQVASPSPPTPTPTVPQPVVAAASAPTTAPVTPASIPTLAAAAPAAPVLAPRFDAAYLRNPAPAYPRASRRLGEEGRVVLRVRVERDGSASRLEVQASSGSSRLDEAAFDAVRHWRFVAARRGDDNIAAWVLVPIEFRLNNG